MNAEDFWSPWEAKVDSFDEAMDLVHTVFKRWSLQGNRFAWRGQVDATWPLHSSLYRRLILSSAATSAPQEAALHSKEGEILAELHRWGLHFSPTGRLAILPQLAVLQHYGAPTRMLDVSFNPLIGLWFAVEKKYENGVPLPDDKDARLFAIDVTKRLINENTDKRSWEDDLHRPWPKPRFNPTEPSSRYSTVADHEKAVKEWQTTTLAWRPSRFDGRIAAQDGGFVFGGVPGSRGPDGPVQWPKSTNGADGKWAIDEVRSFTSIPLRVHKLKATRGRPHGNAVYTIRVAASAKQEIRKRLQDLFGYRHSTLYPDYMGFAQFGVTSLKARP